MPAGAARRSAASAAVDEFLARTAVDPSALLLEGEPGIGKTTIWLSALERSRQRGFRVLSARPAEAESVLPYASVTDLLAGVDTASANLPAPQRHGLDQALLRAESDGVAVDHRAVAAGFLSVVKQLAEESPVLLAIDDLQWLDASSTRVIAFAARRISSRVGVLGTVRTGQAGGEVPWLQLPRPDSIRRIRVPPLSLGALHTVISERLGLTFARPKMVRIHEISGGNPFYALELARSMGAGSVGEESALPATLAEMVEARISTLTPAVQDVLLAAACVTAPTIDLLARATDSDVANITGLLEEAEAKGISGIDGHYVRFTHPLLARGVYTRASPARRRKMHQRMASIIEQPELRARHLALAAVSGDHVTLQSLDIGAEMARMRGAPAAAAELLDLALGLGGDTPERRIRAADNHLTAGDLGRAGALLEEAISLLGPGPLRAEALNLLAAVSFYRDSYPEAIKVVECGLGEVGENLNLRLQMLITQSMALLNIGDLAGAARAVEDAVTSAEGLGREQLLSQALGIRTLVRFVAGQGLDEASLRRAVDLEDPRTQMLVAFRPSMQNALLLACTGRLEQARQAILSARRESLDRGDEGEAMFAVFYSVLIELWRDTI